MKTPSAISVPVTVPYAYCRDCGTSLVNYSYLADGTKLSTLGKRTSAPKKSITLELPKLIVPYKVLKTTSHEKDFAHNLHD